MDFPGKPALNSGAQAAEILHKRAHEAVEQALSQAAATPPPSLPEVREGLPIVATGLGSSEAHARFLVHEVNRRCPGRAHFRPTISFYPGQARHGNPEAILMVFSQGLSANARIALEQRHNFRRLVLFTASTPEGLEKSGKADRAAYLKKLLDEGAQRVGYPIEDEYTILIRLIGPLCGYVAALQWLAAHWPFEYERPVREALNAPLPANGELRKMLSEWSAGVDFLATHSLPEYGQNLVFKTVEGLFLPPPALHDALGYAHGPFQQHRADAKNCWIFTTEEPPEKTLLERLTALTGCLQGASRVLYAPVSPPFSILYFERLLNACLTLAPPEQMERQMDWPGRGEDAPIYSLQAPFSDDKLA
jgi:hypothetical protein